MAKPNYSFEKRKKELDRQKKKEEKKSRKNELKDDNPESGEINNADDVTQEQE